MRAPDQQKVVYLAVNLVIVVPDAPDDSSANEFDIEKEAGLNSPPVPITTVDQRPVDGLGDEAYIFYGVVDDERWEPSARAEIIVRIGNAEATVDYDVDRVVGTGAPV